MLMLTGHPYRVCFLIVAVVLCGLIIFQHNTSAVYAFDGGSDQFYTCPNGFTFEARHQAARCIRYPQESFVKPTPCKAPFSTLNADYQHMEDRCLSAMSEPTLISCPAGSEIFVQPGNDLCVKRQDGAISAPFILTKR